MRVGTGLVFMFYLYLITTGQTVTSNLEAMITGYEELPDEPQDDPAVSR